MATVLSVLLGTQSDCKSYGLWLKERAPELENFFAMLHNHAMSAQEILDSIGNLRVKTRKEADQRIMLVLRSAWIFGLSVVEYSMKKIIRESESGPLVKWYQSLPDSVHEKGVKRGFSLRSVIAKSYKLGLVDKNQQSSWTSLQDMRNAIIHNNGYLEGNKTFTIGQITKDIKSGEKVRYSHLDGAYFIRLIPAMSKDWLEKYLASYVLQR